MESSLKERAKEMTLDIRRRIKSIAPCREYDVSKIAYSDIREGYLDGQSIERVILILRSRGCSWALKEEGGCNMCGHYAGTTRGKEIPTEDYVNQFMREFRKYDWRKYSVLCLYNSGSLLNDEEISSGARQAILEFVAKEDLIKAVILESRTEYVNDDMASEIHDILGDKRVEIGIGMETADDKVRDLCINKGFTLSDIAESVKTLKKYDIKPLAYILIKPPFLYEHEAIDDAIASAKTAFDIGFDVVSFEPVSVQSFTIVQYLHEADLFRPPWIWSVLEVAKATKDVGFIRLGGFEFMPIPLIFTHNCSRCDAKAVTEIQEFNRTYRSAGFKDLNCSCKADWRKDLEHKTSYYRDPHILEERIINFVESIDYESTVEKIVNKMSWRFLIRPEKVQSARYW